MVEIAAIVLLLVYSADEKLEAEISKTTEDAFRVYGGNQTSSEGITAGIDLFQVRSRVKSRDFNKNHELNHVI